MVRRGMRVSVWTLAGTIFWPAATLAQAPSDLTALGPFLDSVMAAEAVPGLSFAVFDDQGVVFEHVAGVRSARTGQPVDAETVFEAASISKPVFAYTVLSLLLDGVLDLDAPLTELVDPLPDIGYDPRSALLTPRLLLSHQGGLPNWRSRLRFQARDYDELFAPGDSLRFRADPGDGYLYSGEGFVLLQRAVEIRTDTPVSDLVRERVFEPLGMTRSEYRYEAWVRSNAAEGHDAAGEPAKWVIEMPLASSTMHTTARDLARFGVELAGQIRNAGPYARLVTPEVIVASEGDDTLEWGLGLGVVTRSGRRYVYHGGNNVIFIADFVYGVDDNLGYALLTNSALGQKVVDAVELRFFGKEIR